MCSHAPASRVRSAISANGSKAPVLTLPACAHTIVPSVSRRKRVAAHAPLAVHWHPHEPVAAEPDEAERLDQRGVRLLADHDRDRRRTEQPVRLDIPVPTREHRVPGCDERAEVGHRGARDERGRAAFGQPEDILHPLQGDGFEHRHGRSRPNRRRRSDPRPRPASSRPAQRAATHRSRSRRTSGRRCPRWRPSRCRRAARGRLRARSGRPETLRAALPDARPPRATAPPPARACRRDSAPSAARRPPAVPPRDLLRSDAAGSGA